MNIGYSGRLQYDKGAYKDKLEDVTGSVLYKLNPNSIYNCSGCLSTLGPRGGFMAYGVSTPSGHVVAQAQTPSIIDVESDLTNRTLKNSKLKSQEVNFIDVKKYGAFIHAKKCSNFLDPMATRLMNPPCTYREMSINRFFNTINDEQTNIFWQDLTNTRLESKDNFRPRYVIPNDKDRTLPIDKGGRKCVRLNVVECEPK
jgi:hypothetical protein